MADIQESAEVVGGFVSYGRMDETRMSFRLPIDRIHTVSPHFTFAGTRLAPVGTGARVIIDPERGNLPDFGVWENDSPVFRDPGRLFETTRVSGLPHRPSIIVTGKLPS
ncbi:MAG: hypothetical protein LBI59_10700 [Candidatus Accumulibacter sp.]|jgi:hypothetical protein|nr:hypothetical protein [Accumulibacter sp.]